MIDHTVVEAQVREIKRGYVQEVLDILGAQDMNQSDLARACGLQRQHLNLDLHHNHNSTLWTLCRIAAALGYKVRITLEKEQGGH